MASFKIAHDNTAHYEGFYSNDSVDRGGETIFGIARKKNPNWKGWAIVDELKKKPGFPDTCLHNEPLRALEFSFYKQEYWDKFWGDRINSQPYANSIYGKAVNFGPGSAIKDFQNSAALGFNTMSDKDVHEKLLAMGIVYGVMNEKTLQVWNS